MFSIIAFSERCELKKVTVNEPGVYVIKRDRLYATVRGIWDTTSDALTEEQFELLHEKLNRLTNASKAKKRAHIESIEAQFSVGKRNVPIAGYATVSEIQQPQITTKDITLDKTAACGGLEETAVKATPPFCPKCGAPMVLRTAKCGQRAGKQFYGCSNYPSCKGIVNIG